MERPIESRDVVERLRELAGASADVQPSPEVEAELLRAFADRCPRRAGQAPRILWPLTAAAATVLVIATALVLRMLVVASGDPRPFSSIEPVAGPAERTLDGFVLVPGASSLPTLESASIVRYELPSAALAAYGLEIAPDPSRSAVQADLLIGQDGHTRAIRLWIGFDETRSTP